MIPTGYNLALNGKTNAILKKRRWISPRRIWNNNADKESKAIPTGMETHKWKIDICKVYTTNLNIGVTVVLVFSSTNERFEGTKESFMEQVQEDNNNIPNYNVDIPSITGSRFQCEVW